VPTKASENRPPPGLRSQPPSIIDLLKSGG